MFDWSYTFSLLAHRPFWGASGIVVALATLSWVTSVILALGIALIRQNASLPFRAPTRVYVWLFRSMPLLVLIIFVYNLPQAFPVTAPVLNISFWSGFFALVLSESAYISEIHRGGLMSVGQGQYDASRALGLRYRQTMLRVVLPQAFRVAMPGLGNQYVYILKLTSLVSVIALHEILMTGQMLYTQNFKILETLLAVSFYYIVLVSIFDVLQRQLEKKLDITNRHTPLLSKQELASKTELPRDVDEAQQGRNAKSPRSKNIIVGTENLCKSFDDVEVLHNIDLTVREGDVTALVGASGSGKTTLLRVLNHLEEFDSGSVRINGRPMGYEERVDGTVRKLSGAALARQRQDLGMVFQHFHLFPHLTVMQNITLAPRITRRNKNSSHLETEVFSLLQKVGMGQHAYRYPHQLSGGQQQRAAIARALAMKPKVMLFDEPTSALDPESIGDVLQVISTLAAEGMTMVISTHEMQFVDHSADWVVFLDNGEIVEEGPPDKLLNTPRQQRTREFFSSHVASR